MSCGFEHADGAYVLGALSPEDRVAFERHLSGCESCARSVRELAGLPGLLSRVPAEVLDPEHQPPPVPDTLLPTLIRRAKRTRRRRALATAGLVAAAVLVTAGVVGVAVSRHDTPPAAAPTVGPTTAAPRAFERVGSEQMSGWVSLTKVGWGTRLDLTCSYAAEEDEAYDAGGVGYTMVVTRTDGGTEQVGSWRGLPGRTVHVSAATSAEPAEIASVEVRTAGGEDVLRLVTG